MSETTPTRTPQWIDCRRCQHAWVAVYLPLPADVWARIVRAARCPMCGAKPAHVYEAGITPEGHRAPLPAPQFFRTVADFHQVPVGKLRACLEDFFLWLVMCRVIPPGLEGIAHAKDTDTFGWIDDGRHDANFRVELAPALTSLTAAVVDRGGTEHARTWSAEELEAVSVAASEEEGIDLVVSAVVEPDASRVYAYCPGLIGVRAGGDTEEEALAHLQECLAADVLSRVKHREPLPVGPSIEALTQARDPHDPSAVRQVRVQVRVRQLSAMVALRTTRQPETRS